MNTKAFWKRIKQLAREKNITQQDLAAAIGMPLNTLKHWMSTETVPSLDYTVELSLYFGVSIHYLVHGKEADMSGKIRETQKLLETARDSLKSIRRGITMEQEARKTKDESP